LIISIFKGFEEEFSFFFTSRKGLSFPSTAITKAKAMARGKHAPFRLWALIVAWVFQLLFLIFVLGLYIVVALALSWSSVGTTITYA
jgi:hypothetical protein